MLYTVTNAQPFGFAVENYHIVRQEYENSSGEKGSTVFKYGLDGRLTQSRWSLKDTSRYSDNYYEHDAEGNLISAFRVFSDGLTSCELFTYDSTGNKTFEQFLRSESISGSASYVYEESRLTKAELNKFKGWMSCTILYEYNSYGQRTSGLIFKNDKQVGIIQYAYDLAGNLSLEHWDFDGQWSQTFLYFYQMIDFKTYFYSSPFLRCKGPFRISGENYTFNNETGGPSEYLYNEDDLLAQKVFTRSDGVSTKTRYHYDKSRKLISSEREYSNGETARFTYTYNHHDQLIARNYFRADTLYGFESYLYNALGELEMAYLKNFDNWLTGTLTFTTDFSGTVTSGKFIDQDGFDAEVSFKYNSLGNLTSIKWDFSFGKFQEYFFNYESYMIDQ